MTNSRIRSVFASLLLLVFVVDEAAAQRRAAATRLTPSRAKAVDAAIGREMKKQQLVGVAVGVIENGRIVYLKGYGFADREQRIPVSTKTKFRWASISKTLTAIVAMQLVEQGKLDLKADVRKYVPEFPRKREGRITSRDLLCHQGGIVHYTNGRVIRTKRKYKSPHPFADVVLALDTFKDSPLVNAPRAKYSYTTRGYILLSAVVQRAGKQRFADQVAQRISKPLLLTTLQPDYQWQKISNRAVGYRKRNGKIVRSTNTDVSWKLGGGGFLSNIDDLAKYAAGLINGKLVSRKTTMQMWTPQKTSDGKTTRYGLGFVVSRANGQLLVSHNGSQEKTKTRMLIDPKGRRGIVVMSNTEHANPTELTNAVIRALRAK